MSSPFEKVLDALGIGELPWVIRAYLTLFICCAILMAVAAFNGNFGSLSPEAIEQLPMTKMFNFAADAEKTILGALIGSLSLAATKQFGGAGQVPKPRNTARKREDVPLQSLPDPDDESGE